MGLEKIGVQAVVQDIGNYLSDMNRLNKATDSSADSLNRASKSSEAMSKALSGIGKVVAGLGLTGLFVGATKEAGDFDKSLRNIQATAGLTDKQIAGMGKSMLDMSKDSVYGSQQIASAMYDIVGGVQDASKWNAILTESLKTAAAGQAELKSTTSGLVFIMNAYGLSAKDASMVSDVLTRTVAVGVGTMDDFVSAISPLAVSAKTLSLDFKDLGAMTAYLTSKGVSASESATELQSIMQALLKPTGAMKDAFKALGYSTGSAMLKTLGFSGTLNALRTYAGGSTDALAEMFQRVEGFKGVLALTNGDFENFNKNFQKGVKGATDLAKAIQEKALPSHIQKLTSSFNELVIETGQKLIPSLIKIVDVIKDVIDGMGDTGPAILLLAGAFGALALAAGPLGTALAIILSPIGAIIAGVVALGAAFSSNFLGIRDLAESVWNAVKGPLEGIANAISTFVNTLFGGGSFGGALANLGNALEPFLADLGWKIKHGIELVLSSLGIDYRVVQILIDQVKIIFDRLSAGIQGFAAKLQTVDWEGVKLFFSQLGITLANLVGLVTATVIAGLQSIGDILPIMGDALASFLNALGNLAEGDIQGFLSGVAKGIESIGLAALSLPIDIAARLGNFLGIDIKGGLDAWQGIHDNLVIIVEAIKTKIETTWQNISQAISTAVWNLKFTILMTWFGIQEGISTVITNIRIAVENAWNGIVNFINNIANNIRTAFTTVSNAITGALQPALDAIAAIQAFLGAGGMGTGTGGIIGGNMGPSLPSIPIYPHALGGAFGSGDNLMVGEGGPELVSFSRPGFVFPNSVSQMLSNVLAQSVPAPAYASNYAYNNTYNQQQSMGDVVMNGVRGTDDAMRRYALLRAMGRVR